MARKFSFPTVIQLVEEVREEGVPRFSRSTFYRMVKRYGWPLPKRTAGKWRRFDTDPGSQYSLEHYKALIKKAYGLT
jgi:hypothetical protein